MHEKRQQPSLTQFGRSIVDFGCGAGKVFHISLAVKRVGIYFKWYSVFASDLCRKYGEGGGYAKSHILAHAFHVLFELCIHTEVNHCRLGHQYHLCSIDVKHTMMSCFTTVLYGRGFDCCMQADCEEVSPPTALI